MGANLTDKEQNVLELRQQGMTYKAIGEKFNRSPEWARQLHSKANRKILRYEKSGIEKDLEELIEKAVPCIEYDRKIIEMRWKIKIALISIGIRDTGAFHKLSAKDIDSIEGLDHESKTLLANMINNKD